MKPLAIAAVCLALAGCAHAPMAEVGPPVASAERLMADVTALSSDAMQGRGFGQPGGALARDYIIEAFTDAGAAPLEGGWLLPFTAPASTRRPAAIDGANIAAVFRGSEQPDSWIVVTAHYDHEGVRDGQIYNGADDNASGTAALIELARLLRDHPPAHSVMLVALDGEEAGLLGAQAFVRDAPVPLDSIVLNINLDMIARGDNGILWVVGTRQYPSLVAVVDALPQQAGIERRYGHDDPAVRGRDNWVNLSDQAAFHQQGVPFIFFSVDDHPDYHQPTDDAERVDAAWYRGSVQTAWELLDAVDGMTTPSFRPVRAGGSKS